MNNFASSNNPQGVCAPATDNSATGATAPTINDPRGATPVWNRERQQIAEWVERGAHPEKDADASFQVPVMSNDAEPSAWITSRSPFVISEPARQIACSFESAGIEFWMVGGNIRDWTMNRESSDEDIVVAPPFQNAEAIVASMPGFSVKGDPNGNAAEHGSFKASAQGASDIIDVTEFRGDVISFQQDASRRDFTINAFGGKVNPDNGEVVEIWDFNDGFGDIVRGLIRAIGDPMKRFDGNEDPGHSRVMRAFRFAARFGFNIHPATLSAIATNRENALMAHRQVIGDEMAKIASAPFAHRVIPQMVSTGLMDVIISAIPGVEETNIAPRR